MSEEKKPNPVKPADALGTLSRRSEGRKISAVLIAALGFLVLVFLAALLFGDIGSGRETPEIPRIELG